MTDERPLADVATGQFGAVTRAQLREAGVTPSELRRRIQSGVLEKAGTGVYRASWVPPSEMSDLATLLLDCGPSAWASGPTAAALHGFDGFELCAPFHVTVPRGRNVQRAHHHIHTTTRLPAIDQCLTSGVRAMAPARTLIDMSRFCSPRALTGALDSALRDRLVTEELLHRRITSLRSQGRYGIPKLLDVIEGVEASRGGHSWLERRYLELVTASGLPKPTTQPVLARTGGRLVRVDCRFEGTPVVVELLGYRWHRTEAQLSRDAERLNALMMQGLVPLQFTYRQVTRGPLVVVATTRAALSQFVSPQSASAA